MSDKKRTIQAIEALGRRVTPADVALYTGLSLRVCGSQLNTIAMETNGHLQVSSAGDLVYCFNPGFQTAYLASGLKRLMAQAFDAIKDLAFFTLKISFGVILIASLFFVIGLLMLFINASNSAGNKANSRHNRDPFLDFIVLRELLFWGRIDHLEGLKPGDKIPRPTRDKRKNFFLNCYSFLFGDPDPDQDLESEAFASIAKLIHQNAGVVCAEQIYPYLPYTRCDEDEMFAVMQRFNGLPRVVSRSGNILYWFPEMQNTALPDPQDDEPVAPCLLERERPFTNIDTAELTPIVVIAWLNFFGTAWLFYFYSRLLHTYPLPVVVMAIYGLLFVTIPLIRLGLLKFENHFIARRNQVRIRLAERLAYPDESLAQKLQEARAREIEMFQIDEKDRII